MRGMGRIFQRGETWWIAFYRGGIEYRESTKSDEKSAAKALLKKRTSEVQAGIFIQPRKVTVNEIIDGLIREHELNGRKGVYTTKCHLLPIREAFGPDLASSVSETRLEKYKEERIAEGKKPATINRELSGLRRAFRIAVKRKVLSTMPTFELFREDNARQGFVEPADFEAVAVHLEPVLQDLARFAFMTGWRKGEVTGLEWSNVDLDGGTVRLWSDETKNGKPRTVAIGGELRDLLERRKEARGVNRQDGTVLLSRFVFHRGDGEMIADFRCAWESAAKKAGREDLLFHDLRRSGVRNMVRAGVPERVAMSISGHRTRAIFDRYDITSERDVQEAARLTEAYLQAKRENGGSASIIKKSS